MVVEEFGNKVPQTMEEMLTPPRRSAQDRQRSAGFLVRDRGRRGGGYARAAASRDRLELTNQRSAGEGGAGPDEDHSAGPLDQRSRTNLSITAGRSVSRARRRCADCTLETLCNSSDKTWSSATNSGRTARRSRAPKLEVRDKSGAMDGSVGPSTSIRDGMLASTGFECGDQAQVAHSLGGDRGLSRRASLLRGDAVTPADSSRATRFCAVDALVNVIASGGSVLEEGAAACEMESGGMMVR